jgi:uncharacterized coiled-coil protein SlyX
MDASSRTYARRKNVHKKVAAKPVPVPAVEGAAPPGLALDSLLSLVGQMRSMAPGGPATALNPKLILTGSGLEIRFAGQAGEGVAAEAPEVGESSDRMAKMEQTLKLLAARISKMDASVSQSILALEAQLGSQAEVVEALRAAVQQNEEMLETLADSMNIMDDLGSSDLGPDLGPELVFGPATIAS